jgi:transcription termination/antitermination protein NusG
VSYWACAQIRASDHRQVLVRVARQGFETYLPMCRPSRRSTKVVPLFPGYLFVYVVDRWRCILGTKGIVNVLRAGDSPAVVRQDEIERIKAQETRDGTIVLPLTKFQPGERVRVVRGPLRDQIGVVHAGMTARQRVAVHDV